MPMKPIYFPFTFISNQVVEALSACFKQTVLYQISKKHGPEKMLDSNKSDGVDIRIPVEGNEKKLDLILKDFRTWANHHQGSEISFLKTQANNIPFFEESSSSQIMAEIKKKGDEHHPPEKTDDCMNARLFLLLAQEYDQQNHTLDEEFLLFKAMEKDLMSNIKGENNDSHIKTLGNQTMETDDPGHFMTKERLENWAHLMQYDQQGSALLVTGSRAVFEYLLETAPESEELVRLNTIPILDSKVEETATWQDELMEALEMIATNDWPSSKIDIFKAPADIEYDREVALTLHIIPDEKPDEFFSRCAEHDLLYAKEKNHGVKFKQTIIGQLEL